MTTPRRRSRSQPIRYAVVGLGGIAQAAVLPAFAHTSRHSVLRALVSGDPQKLERLGNRYGVETRGGYDDYERCLREVDAVYIATPNARHPEFAIRAARVGVHVLCEKPLALTVSECNLMIAACREAGVKLMTAYRLHFEPTTRDVLRLVRDGRIGDPRFVSSVFSLRAAASESRASLALGGGSLHDLGVYCINAARRIFAAEPIEVLAAMSDGARVGLPGIDETTAATLRFADGRIAAFVTSFNAAATSSLRIVGTDGQIVMEPAFSYAGRLSYTFTANGKTTTHRGRVTDHFANQVRYFSGCVIDDRAPEPSGTHGAQDVRIVEALLASARDGGPQTVGRHRIENHESSGRG
ncbi:MAG: Gfo/Idh/MocA family oxidoreductase [Acidobacteriota bacterium]